MMKCSHGFLLAIACLMAACGNNNSTGPNNGEVPTDVGVDQSPSDVGPAPDVREPTDDTGVDAPEVHADAENDGGNDADMSVEPGYEDPAGVSGTRLRRRYLEAGPGAYMTLNFFDNQLMTPCSFGTASDGALRCLPQHPVDMAFKDAACTQPIYIAESQCDSAWVRDQADGSYYRKTDTPAVLAGVFYRKSGASCSSTIIPADAEPWDAALVDPTEFVAGVTVDEARSDNLVARFVEGEDGSRILTTVIHRTRGYECVFDEDETCVPLLQTEALYLDAGCTDKVFASWYPNPPLLRERIMDGRSCTIGYDYYARGNVLTPPALFRRTSNGTCAPTGVSSSDTHYRPGAPIAKETLGQASIAVEGDADMQARRRIDGDGKPLGAVHEFVIAASDVRCTGAELSNDRGFACEPNIHGTINPSYFGDSSCTTNIGIAMCSNELPSIATLAGLRSCELPDGLILEAAFESGTAVPPNIFFSNQYNPSCEPRTIDPRNQPYSLGADAIDSLPRLELRIE